MFMTRLPAGSIGRPRWILPMLAVAAIMLTMPPTIAQVADVQLQPSGAKPERFVVDIAEDLARFNPTFVKPGDTQPERGSFFVTEGNIFPAGTIEGDGATFDPNREGAIGRWICRGTHLVGASEIPAAPLWVNTAQLYLFSGQGRDSIVTEGVEGSVPVVRAIAGGTGVFREFVGEQRQEFLGFNATGGVNLRVTFVPRKKASR
jgi:hypothetical protein